MNAQLQALRHFFATGATKPYRFRMLQLQNLKAALVKYEVEINQALFADLKKSPEETYANETGLLLADITFAIKNLKEWMRPQRIQTNLLNLPSSSLIYQDPLGVVLIIAPWNYPFQLSLIPLVGAIAAGNCILLKPSELAPATAAIIAKILAEIFPEQYIKVVQGDGAELIPRMMSSFRFDHVFYTGSSSVGKFIYQLAAKDLIPVTLELGGKSPAVVESDANLSVAARRIALGKFVNAGQTCVAPDYVLVDYRVKDLLVSKLRDYLKDFFGDDASQSMSYGKIINEKRFDKLSSYLRSGKILFGGQLDRSKLFIAPTIIDDVSMEDPIMQEEIFGPILPVFGFKTTAEAMSIIQKNPDPLAFYVFTGDTKKEQEWIQSIPFGSGCVNNTVWQFSNNRLPFGGIGYSGMGAYHGKHSFYTFTHAKSVMRSPLWFDPDLKYPPFSGKLSWFKLFIR